jgi:hypothetical protein
MLVVIPISSSDAELSDAFASALNHFGPTGFDALIVSRPSDSGHAGELQAKLDSVFNKVSVHIFPADGPSGWPKGPNFYWAQTVAHLLEIKNDKPWLWLELDSTPLCKDWALKLFTAYNLGGKAFLGVKEPTLAQNAEGKVVSTGDHMVGVGIYPPAVPAYSLLWTYVPQMNDPFDVVCQWEFLPHLNDSPLIQHAFRTKDYHRDGDAIVCSDNSDLPEGVSFARPLSTEAVLHHGCDDSSLATLLVRKTDQVSLQSPVTKTDQKLCQEEAPKKPEPAPSDVKRRVAAIREQGVMA